jgi:hypothetical protein
VPAVLRAPLRCGVWVDLMTSIFLVTESDWEYHKVHSAWSSMELAEAEMKRMRGLRRRGRRPFRREKCCLVVEESRMFWRPKLSEQSRTYGNGSW